MTELPFAMSVDGHDSSRIISGVGVVSPGSHVRRLTDDTPLLAVGVMTQCCPDGCSQMPLALGMSVATAAYLIATLTADAKRQGCSTALQAELDQATSTIRAVPNV